MVKKKYHEIVRNLVGFRQWAIQLKKSKKKGKDLRTRICMELGWGGVIVSSKKVKDKQ